MSFQFFRKKVTTPALIIYGDYVPLSGEVADVLKKDIVKFELATLPNCGHFPFIESKELFLATLNHFYSNIKN